MPPKLPIDYSTPRPFAAAEAPYRINHAIPPLGGSSYHPLGSSSGSTAGSTTSASTTASVSGTSTSVPYNHPRRLAITNTNEAHVSDSSTPSSTNKEKSKSSSNDTTPGSGSNNESQAKQSVLTGQPNLNPAGSTTRPTTSPVQISSPIPSSSSSPIAPLLSSSLPPLAADATPFEIVLHQAHIAGTMPGPGLSYFEARRALWSHPPANPPTLADPSPSRVKLEALLSQPGAVESEEVWRAGLKNVWKGLVGGNQLRQPLPLNVVLKILQAGWLRDGTWPEGLVAPAWEEPPPPPPEPPEPAPENATLAQREEQREQQEAYVVAAAAHARQMQEYIQNQIPPGYSPSSGDLPESNYYAQPYAYAQPTPPPQEGILYHRDIRMEQQHEGVEEVPPSPERPGDVDDDDDDMGIDPGDGRHEGG